MFLCGIFSALNVLRGTLMFLCGIFSALKVLRGTSDMTTLASEIDAIKQETESSGGDQEETVSTSENQF